MGCLTKESTSGFVPWADAPEESAQQIVGSAQSVEIADGEGMHAPGTVVLEVVERDVDYSKLPEWQRDSLQELRNVNRVEYPDLFTMKALELLIQKWWNSRRSTPQCRIRTDRGQAGIAIPPFHRKGRKTMARETLREAFAKDLAVKAVIWGPSIAGVMLLGPVGLLLGPAVFVALVASGGQGNK